MFELHLMRSMRLKHFRLPATNVLSQTPSIRSVIKTAAVTRVAKKKTILQIRKMEIVEINRSDGSRNPFRVFYVIITPGAAYSWKSALNDE